MSSESLLVSRCAICSDIASGLHYGVLACEGCKGFFRRIITTNAGDKADLVCTGLSKNNCNIMSKERSICQRCRLQKCFNVGMTRKHSKLGRKRKASIPDSRNVKSSVTTSRTSVVNGAIFVVYGDEMLRNKIREENSFFLNEIGMYPSNCREDTESDKKLPAQQLQHRGAVIPCKKTTTGQQQLQQQQQKDSKFFFDRLPSLDSHMSCEYLFSPSLSNFWSISDPIDAPFTESNPDSIVPTNGSDRKDHDSPNRRAFPLVIPIVKINVHEIDALFEQMNSFIHKKSRQDPDYQTFLRFRKAIYTAHMETCVVTLPIMENFFNTKYQAIPVENDPNRVWEIMINEMSPITHRVINFCNHLPEFKDCLPITDTVNVIKLALFDIISIRYLRLVDFDRRQFFDPKLTRKIPAEVMAQNPLGTLFLRYFYVAEFVKRELKEPIDDYEMAYMSALCLTLPGWESNQKMFVNSSYLNRLKFFYCLCLYDHLLVRKYKGNTYETRTRVRLLYTLLDKIKIVTKTQVDLLLSSGDNKIMEIFPLILQQIYFDEFEVVEDEDSLEDI